VIDIYKEYKPEYCWYCAGELELLGYGNKWQVHCKLCERLGPEGETPDIAVERWNRVESMLKNGDRFEKSLFDLKDRIEEVLSYKNPSNNWMVIMSETTLPCEWCEASGSSIRIYGAGNKFQAVCGECQFSGPEATSKEIAIMKWNILQKELAQLSRIEDLMRVVHSKGMCSDCEILQEISETLKLK
jgi:hypothetical protein